VAERKSFLLRADASILEAMQRWANDDLRSLNAQVEFVLREALRDAGRLRMPASPEAAAPDGAREQGGQSKQSGQSGQSGEDDP
jgi:hypothetical protein